MDIHQTGTTGEKSVFREKVFVHVAERTKPKHLYLRTKQKSSPDTYYQEAVVSDHLILNVTLPIHSVILIEITEESNILKYT